MTFRTSWWKAGEKRDENNTGTFVYDHPATRAMAPDGWCDDGWFDLIEGGCKFDLEKAPARPEVMIRALPSLMLPADEALLFEVGVGKGSLIVSGLNHRRAEGRPENEWLIARLLDHAAKLPQPKAKWPASFSTVAEAAPDGCLPGFRRLIANEGETCAWYTYREDSATTFVCRQDKPGHLVAWETPPLRTCRRAIASHSFCRRLGLWFRTQNGRIRVWTSMAQEALRFDIPEPAKWQSADRQVALQFVARRTISVDQFGLFYLTVPRDMLKPGKPCRLGVRSLGTGSRRWFALYPYSDVR